MLHLDCLPTQTRHLFEALSEDPDIRQAVLIGGTALALFWRHRQSEDLDFAFRAMRLPRGRCAAVLDRLRRSGWATDDIGDQTARLYWENEGTDLADAQQDWLCRRKDQQTGVKLTFFTEFHPDKATAYDKPRVEYGNISILNPDGLFILKSQLLFRRTTLRDLFDIWAFLDHGYTLEGVLSAVRLENPGCSYETLRARLSPPRLPATDPGFSKLIERGPRNFTELKAALGLHIDAYERQMAEQILTEKPEDESRLEP